ncbi:disease resistance protein RPV1 [Trifolium repens]|nr:disease resistance protein RPV1 [Trifolium repens]
MRVLNFDDDRDLSQIPDLSRSLPKLEVLSIQRCHSLYTIDKSVGFLRNLKVLRIRSCYEIKSVPPLLYCSSLVELDLSDCSELVTIDESVVDLGNLQILRLTGCKRIKSVPPLYCPSLVELYLSDCFELESFSVGDGFGDKLKIMSVARCFNLRSIPPLKLSSLEELDLSDCRRLDSFPLMEDGFLGKIEILRAQGCHNLKSIPRLNLNSLKELNLPCCYSLESFPSVVDDGALLENIRLFNIEECILLKSIPPLSVTWLKKFNISHCPSLESFPEILGDMRNIPELHLDNIPKELLPLPLQNLTPPHTLYSCHCGIVDFPNRVAEVSVLLAESTIEVEGHVSPTKSSLVEYICLCYRKLSDEYWSKSFMLFAKVKELHLINNEFTVLPKSMENCKFLWRLVLDDCVKLQEIKGIPPCLKVFSALNCQLLTSSSKSKLLNQKLHEAGNTWFLFPLAKIPEWFDHQCSVELSISFWFRNKFPAIILCVVSSLIWYRDRIRVIINGNTFFYTHCPGRSGSRADTYHLHLFHMNLENFNDNMDKALLENEWNHAQVDFGYAFMYSGIHVLKDKSSIKDFQLTNPEIE